MTDSELHANFSLEASGGYLALTKVANGQTIILSEFNPYPSQFPGISSGLSSDAVNLAFFTSPTPDAANGTGFGDKVRDTSFAPDRGFYDAAFNVEITSATVDAQIRYTTNGTDPTPSSGILYTEPVNISTTTTLKAIAFKSGQIPTNVDCHTYVFLDDVLQQPSSPAGFPGGTDYGMDPDVVNNPLYSSTIKDDLKAIPSISLAMSTDDLFGPRGIYENASQSGVAWERPGSMEVIFPDGTTGMQQNCGVRMQGGVGRNSGFPKHSFRLLFKREYGDTKLRYPLFQHATEDAEGATDTFDTITLRSGFNNTWHRGSSSEENRAQYLRDQFIHDSQLAMGHASSHGTFVHLYCNGLYWGLYNVVERPNADFASSYYGGEKDEWDALNSYPRNVVDGTAEAWVTAHSIANQGVADQAGYDAISQYVDIPNLIDYMLLNFYGGNLDWDDHNWYSVRRRLPGEGYKFVSWDAERTLESISGDNKTGVAQSDKPSRLYSQLRANPEFRLQFADRAHRHLFNGGALTPAKTIERYQALADYIDRAIVGESARWGDSKRSNPYTRNVEWIAERDRLLNSYLPQRSDVTLSQLRSANLYPNTDAPTFSQHGGSVPTGYNLSMSAQGGVVFYTTDGSDPRSPIEVTIISNDKLVQSSAEKRALIPTEANGGATIGDSWRNGSDFDDSSWTAGTGGVGYETGSGYENFIGIDVVDSMSGVNTSAFIRIPFSQENLDLSVLNFMTLSIRYDDGFVAFLNGVQIASANPPPALQWSSNAIGQNGDSSAVNFENFDISQFLGALRSGLNVLAIQGLNVSTGSSDFLIDAELSVGQREIERGEVTAIEYSEPVELEDLVTVKARTFDGAEWSALNEATFTVGSPRLIISELNYHPASPSAEEVSLGFDDPDDFEFIEFFNPDGTTFDLSDVYFSDGVVFTFADSSVKELRPGEYVLVVRKPDAFEARFGGDKPVAGEYSGGLSNSGERIALSDSNDVILEFYYGVSDPWPPTALDEGRSLQLISDGADPSLPESWRASSNIGGSPGQVSISGPLLVERVYIDAGQLHLVFNAGEEGNYSIRSSNKLGSGVWDMVQSVDLTGIRGETDVAIGIPDGVSQSYFQIVRSSLP